MNKVTTIFIFLLLLFLPVRIFAQQLCEEQDPCTNLAPADKPACYDNVINSCKNQRDTLSSQINYMNNQIRLTSIRIDGTKTKISTLLTEIDQLENEVNRLEGVLTKRLELLSKRIPESYKRTSTSQFGLLLFSKNFSDLINRVKYLSAVQEQDAVLIFQVKATQNNYNERKATREEKKNQLQQIKNELERQNVQLAQQEQAKNLLLIQTQGKESIYQQLLAQAKAQLAGFSSFASSQGGATILTNQTVCDDWGCYYNQRDAQWGNVSLNNTQYTIASDGCLVTSMAMMYTHFGHRNVTPLSINANPLNFASYYPAFLNKTIVADGMTTTRVASTIDSELNSNRPVIVGIRYSNGDTHFMVLISGSNGNYRMNDPFAPNGHNIPFDYPLNSIYEIERISM
jgi:peptidoglycan hydrolase CwlO-like protein